MLTVHDFAKFSPQRAQQAISQMVGGQPPPSEMLNALSVGLEEDIQAFIEEYFAPSSFIVCDETHGCSFKIVEAYYGGGKTHYLRTVERAAHEHGFASAFINLTKDECPLTRFDLIYGAVAENLSVPDGAGGMVRGIGKVIRHWCDGVASEQEEPIQALQRGLDAIGDPPLVSMKLALRHAVMAHSSNDQYSFEQALVYLTGGKIAPDLRRPGVLQPIDPRTGGLALRSLAYLIKRMGYAGFILIMDEGDRSLSIATTKERTIASNNLVQIINETASDDAWPSSLLLYSIPSWTNFEAAFGNNQALISRVEGTGFPMVPPAPRITLDDREAKPEDKIRFCNILAERLDKLFERAYAAIPAGFNLKSAADQVARKVVDREFGATYRRLFVQSYLTALYAIRSKKALSDNDVDVIVGKQASTIAASGT